MTDPIMDLIRSANPYPDLLEPLPIDSVRPRTGGQEPIPRGRGPRVLVPDLEAVIGVIVVGMSLAIAVLAIALPGRAHRLSPAGTGRSATVGLSHSSVSEERQRLIASLAALRRAQTKADRRATLPGPFRFTPHPSASRLTEQRLQRRQAGDPTIDRPLLRTITTTAGDLITVAPETYQPSRSSSRRAEGLAIALRTPGNQMESDTGPRPVSVGYFLTHGLAVFNDTRRGAVLVPDGVARVELTGFGPVGVPGHITADSAEISGESSEVHDNLATFKLAGLTATSSGQSMQIGASPIVHMIWFNARGRTITHTSTRFGELYITVHGSQTAPSRRPGTISVLAGELSRETTSAAFDTAAGTFALQREGPQDTLTIDASRLPPAARTGAYGVWLANLNGRDRFLGYVATRPQDGRLQARAAISPSTAQSYQFIELTIQMGSGRPSPRLGEVILRGKLR